MNSVTSSARPVPKQGKRLDQELYQTLPYEPSRVSLDCHHNAFYAVRFYPEQPFFCGLCFFREAIEGETPNRIHQFKTLADNGNPETSPKLMAHLQVSMGLVPPRSGESLPEYRKRRSALAREPYTRRSPTDPKKLVQWVRAERFSSPSFRLFPVTSALWKLMGYQPPLGRVLVEGVNGRTEREIAEHLSTSVLDIHIRMVKAIRVGMGFIPDGSEAGTSTSSGRSGTSGPEALGIDE